MKNKKKNIIIVAFLIIFSFAIILFTLYRLKNNSTPFDQINFYTVLSIDNKEQQIYVEFNDEENPYTGKIYIPGSYSSRVKLYWGSSKKSFVISDSDNEYESGQYLLNENLSSFKLLLNKEIIDVQIAIVKTSKNINPLFINIDEPLGLIDDMNNDSTHNTSCYGTVDFNNNSYNMSIKGRGNSTWNLGLKKPYNISFLDKDYSKKQSVSMIDGVETEKWSLLANYNDPTLLRNKIGYDLANGLSVGIDSKLYDVWMNGKFLGNYLITPKNDYQATKDGYILEIDNVIDEIDPQFRIKDNNEEITFPIFTIKSNGGNVSVDNIREYMQKTWDAIKDYDSNDYLKYIDIDSFAKMYLLHEIYKNYDVVSGSILLHRDGQNPESKLVAGPVWDLDNAFGTLSPNPENGLNDDVMFTGGYWYISSIDWLYGDYCILQELGKHKDFLDKVQDVYLEYKDFIMSLPNQIKNYSENNYDSFLADFDRWGNNRSLHDFYTDYDWNYDVEYAINYQTTNTYDDYLQNLLKYVDARTDYIDNNISNIK